MVMVMTVPVVIVRLGGLVDNGRLGGADVSHGIDRQLASVPHSAEPMRRRDRWVEAENLCVA
jgi:hypothetical protein